jgi:hypothetical protein
MRERGATDFLDRSCLAKINCHVASFHRCLNRIADIALANDLNVWFVPGKVDNGPAHSSGGTDEQDPHDAHGSANNLPLETAAATTLAFIVRFEFVEGPA